MFYSRMVLANAMQLFRKKMRLKRAKKHIKLANIVKCHQSGCLVDLFTSTKSLLNNIGFSVPESSSFYQCFVCSLIRC